MMLEDTDGNLEYLMKLLYDTDWNINSAVSTHAIKMAYSRYHNELISHLEKLRLLVVADYLAWFPFGDFINVKEIGHGVSAKVFKASARLLVALKELSICITTFNSIVVSLGPIDEHIRYLTLHTAHDIYRWS